MTSSPPRPANVLHTRVELHFHLLPGVDDGPRTLDESLMLARMALEDGTAFVVCTPHVECVDVGSLPDRVHEVQRALREAGVALQIAAGGEIRAGTQQSDRDLEILAHGPPGRRWVLLEAPLEPDMLASFHEHADELEARGYGLLVGHPERCAPLLDPAGGLDRRLRRGAKLQVNASSLTGAHGLTARSAGFGLLARGMVAVVASDAHGSHRPPLLRPAARLLSARAASADALTMHEPRRLLSRGFGEPGRVAATLTGWHARSG